MTAQQIVAELTALADLEKVRAKEKKFGVQANNSLGIYHKDLTAIAKTIGRDSALATELYATDIYEARLLCSKLFDPNDLTEQQMDQWAAEFENWEICDSFCMGLFNRSRFATTKAHQWTCADQAFVKRAGFAIMASYGFADKKADNEVFEAFLVPIEREATDERLYVRKAVNWALRSIGKRNVDLRRSAIEAAHRIGQHDNKAAKWVANNALAELEKPQLKLLDYPRHLYRPA